MVIPYKLLPKLTIRFRGLGAKVVSAFPGMRYDLKKAQLDIPVEQYAVGSFFSSMVWGMIGIVFGALFAILKPDTPAFLIILPLLGYALAFFIFLVLHIYFPKLLAKQVAQNIDRQLIYAARDMLIQSSSGIPLYQVIANVSEGDYGEVSREFAHVVEDVRTGTALSTALEDMAVRNNSIYLNKMCWQLITAMRSGSNLTTALKGIIKILVDFQLRLIKSYNAKLNFIVLIYLMVSAVLPTIGSTMLVIFSLFGVLGISPPVYGGLVGFGFFIQICVIYYIKSTRPKIFD